MVELAQRLGLRDDQFAVYFAGTASLAASDLGKFLQRASTLARHRGAILLVDDIKPGSLAVIFRAARKSAIAKAVRKEFKETPVKTTAAAGALTGIVAGAIISAMSSDSIEPTPLARAGAEIAVEHCIEQIEVVTTEKSVVVMDQQRAARIVRYQSRTSKHQIRRIRGDVEGARSEAQKGTLTGALVDLDGMVHFRPDGYNFLVPVVPIGLEELPPPGHYRIVGQLSTRYGAPDQLYLREAHPV